MVKSLIGFTLVTLLIIIYGGGRGTNSNDLDILSGINTEVSNLFEVDGPGVPLIEGYEKVIASKEANCTQYAYVFARRAAMAGYKVKVIGITTLRSAHHAVVNVQVGDRWYMFDPTNGIYYKADAFDIFQKPELVNTMVGTPTKTTKVYTEKRTFQEMNELQIFDNLDYAEKDISHEAKVTEQSEFYGYPNGVEASVNNSTDTDYTAALEDNFPNYFVLKWEKPVNLYRVSINWFDDKNYASDFEIQALVDGKFETVISEKGYSADDEEYEKVLSESVKTDQIKFVVNKTKGQDRLLMRKFSLYE